MAAHQSIRALMALASPSAPISMERLAVCIADDCCLPKLEAARKVVQHLRQGGWEILKGSGGYALHPDHANLIRMATTPHEPEWSRIPGPCELLQVLENLMAADPGHEVKENI